MAEFKHVEGLKELQDALQQLPLRIATRALRVSVYAGAKVIRDEAKAKAPVYTGSVKQGHPPPGTLKRSIVMKRDNDKSGKWNQVFVVAVRQGKQYRGQGKKGDKSQDAYYWRWVEFGTSKMAARPFMRPAFDGQKDAAVQAIKDRLAARIEEEAGQLSNP